MPQLTITTQPSEEPVSTAELRSHCRIDITDENTLLDTYQKAARITCENLTRRAFVTTTFKLTLDCFPSGWIGPCNWNPIWLPRADVIAVTSITYVDTDGTTQTLASNQYQVTTGHPAKVTPAYGCQWPVTRTQPDAVNVTFTAGYGAASAVPENIKLAIKHLVSHWYNNRSKVEVGTIATEIPWTCEALLASSLWGQN